MAVAACGICCDACGRCLKLVGTTCVPGTDEMALKKLDAQKQFFGGFQCPILACAVEKKVGSCLKDCEEFPCTKFESGFEPILPWLSRLGVKTLFIEPGSPWENGYIESFNGKLRDELINREVFTTLLEAKILIERWRQEYNQVRPHSALGYRPPAPEAVQPALTTATLTLQVV